ncbi:hypothetical protein [Limnofasciculus baicalensis]|nr:hypothetical protein [Limnofasciculus baicalensis]
MSKILVAQRQGEGWRDKDSGNWLKILVAILHPDKINGFALY